MLTLGDASSRGAIQGAEREERKQHQDGAPSHNLSLLVRGRRMVSQAAWTRPCPFIIIDLRQRLPDEIIFRICDRAREKKREQEPLGMWLRDCTWKEQL